MQLIPTLIRFGASIAFIYILSCRFYLRKLRLFHLYHLINRDKASIEDTLLDLVPPDLVRKKMQQISEVAGDHAMSHDVSSLRHDICPCQHKLAVVLQLDMCNFTMLSQKLGACGIAALMHELFSAFDTHLLSLSGSSLFKMDTIGDAYVAAAFLIDPEATDWRLSDASDGAHRAALFASPQAKQAYTSILWLAGMMLETVRLKRESSGLPLHCRIGIGAGGVLAGAMGWLQPRFHLRGPAMQLAELAERSAEVDSVNVPCCVLRAMHGDSHAAGARVCTWPSVRRRMRDSGIDSVRDTRDQEVERSGEVGLAAYAPTGWTVIKVEKHPSCRMSVLWMCGHDRCGCSTAGVARVEEDYWMSCCMKVGREPKEP